jgi:UMF1 family MFS transporter
MLVAFLLYNDGIQTIIRMSSIFGAEIGIDQNAQIAAFVLVQFVGRAVLVPVRGRREPRRRQTRHLLRARGLRRRQRAGIFHERGVALLRAGVPGGAGAGREPGPEPLALRAHDAAAEVVGVFQLLRGVREVCRHLRPALFGASVTLFQSSRAAVLSVVFFFIAGAIVLSFVDVGQAKPRAQRDEALAESR